LGLRCLSTAVIAATVLAILGGWTGEALAAHSADIQIGHDPALPVFFTGTSNPPGLDQVNVIGSNPAYLNNMSGGLHGGATGNVEIADPGAGPAELIAVAIHLTDSAGPSHSLSGLDDPALSAIVIDLNNSALNYGYIAYAYGSPPQQFANAISALSAGEIADGGQPFDILLSEIYLLFPFPGMAWGFDFSNEIGNLDGITALSITDVGAIPEPRTASLMLLCGVDLLRRRCARSALAQKTFADRGLGTGIAVIPITGCRSMECA
jgi:hypothetical protein